jgi:hypothetical protein
LFAEPGAAGHFNAVFFIDSEALGGDEVAFFDDVDASKAELKWLY